MPLNYTILDPQSGTPGVDIGMADSSAQHQVVEFNDQDAGFGVNIGSGRDSTMELGHNATSDLGSFLGRPIRQSAQSWLVNQPFYYTFNPWTAFCENPYVLDKIKNYELLKMNLHVKFVVSGTRFHYGRALVSYNPFTLDDQVTVQRNFISQDLIQASQKPHAFLNPTSNAGAEMHLPFFWNDNYFKIPAASWRDAGQITINSFQNLLHANDGTDPVTITIFIWATDVVLSIPTNSLPPLQPQSGRPSMQMGGSDEYGTGIISKPMAALANFAGNFVNVPKIGPYALATQIAASGISSVSKIFGMSRPSVISDVVLVKPLPAGNLANTDAPDAVQKLTMDSKAELTVDSRVVGLDGTDQMDITEYACRESYLTQFIWLPADNIDDLLWNTRVVPMQLDNVSGEIHMTPLAHMSTLFEQWRGSLKFRFQVVKSDFHKGRILVRWDPNAIGSTVNYNTVYSRVIDIAEMDDFEIIVGWGQATPWKECGTPYDVGSNFSSVARLLPDLAAGNGILDITVLNDLVSPAMDKPVTINVFVSACDDIKFAAPTTGKITDFHLFEPPPLQPQSGVMADITKSDRPCEAEDAMVMAKPGQQSDATYLVFYGDPPTSIRDLCKRYCLTRIWAPINAAVSILRVNVMTNKNLPYHTGWDPEGIDVSASARPITTGPKAFHSWFLPCYAGYRGAIRKKYFFTSVMQTPLITRLPFQGTGNGAITSTPFTANTAVLSKQLTNSLQMAAGAGSAATNIGINDTIEVELPFYWRNRFAAARAIRAQKLQSNSHAITTTSSASGPAFAQQIVIQQHDSVGEDFNLLFFTGIPIMWRYTANAST